MTNKRVKSSVWFNGMAWRHDVQLKACSLAAQGFWIECLCWMWLAGKESVDGTPTQLRRLVGCTDEEFTSCLGELERNGVCTVKRHSDGDLTIYGGKWANQKRSRYIPQSVKHQVLEAGKCRYCGSTERLEVDHILAFANGGTHDPRNLQCLCRTCNRRKKTK